MKIPFWKIFTVMGIVSQWLQESVSPTSDGGVKITANECVALVSKMIEAMGWNLIVGE